MSICRLPGLRAFLSAFTVVLFLTICSATSRLALCQLSPSDGTASTPVAGLGHDYIHELNEIVDPETGALSVRVQIPMPLERGPSLPLYAYLYDSNGQFGLSPDWEPNGNTGELYLSSVTMGTSQQGVGGTYSFYNPGMFASNGSPLTGAQYHSGVPGTTSVDMHTINQYVGGGPTSGTLINCQYWDNFVYTDPNGGRHPLTGFLSVAVGDQGELSCGGLGITQTVMGQTASDGGYTAVFTGTTGVDIFDLHGNQLSPDFIVVDTNGNGLNGTGRTYSQSDSGHPMSATLTVPGLGHPYTYSTAFGAQGQTSPFLFNPTATSSNQDSTCPTSFSGTVGGYSGSANLTLPNLQNFTFVTDPTYGLMHQITYPSGASVTYTWQMVLQSRYINFSLPISTSAIRCQYLYDWPAIQKRVLSINNVSTEEQDYTYTTTWANGGIGGIWTQKTTTVITKDLLTAGTPSYKTVYVYQQPSGVNGNAVNSVSTYDAQGNLLQTVKKMLGVYGSASTAGAGQLGGECTTINGNGLTAGVFYQYAGNSLVSDKAEYDYGTVTAACVQPTTGAPARETVTKYHKFNSATQSVAGSMIRDRPDSVKTYGNGVLLSETDYVYDEYVTYPLASVSPAPFGHDETHFGTSSSAARGNATTITRKCFVNTSSNCSSSVTHAVYDETGQIVETIDGNFNPTFYSYLDSYTSDNGSPASSSSTNTYVTQVTRPPTNGISHISTYKYGFNDGKLRSGVDENSQTTTYCYWINGCSGTTFDPWLRLWQTKLPDGGGSSIAYVDGSPFATVTVSTLAMPNPTIVSQTVYDSVGRLTSNTLTSAGSIETDTIYNGFGQVASISNPYSSLSDPTYGITKYTYDSLGRKTIQTQPDNSVLQWCYNGIASTGQSNCSAHAGSQSNTAWVDVSDESGRHSQNELDGLGRLVATLEPNSTNTPSLETDYQYDALDNLLQVDQWGGARGAPGERQRLFSYDSLSRLQSSTNPETGTVSYSYDGNSNVRTKTDARGVTVTYAYDVLNRLLSKNYSNDLSGTPSSCFQYESATVPYAKGRLLNYWTQKASSGACPATLPSSGILTRRSILAYDAMGRVLNELQCTPSNCSTAASYSPAYTYDIAGNPWTASNGVATTPVVNTLSFTNTFDGAGRLNTLTSNWIDATHPASLFTAQTGPSTACMPSGTSPSYAPPGGLMYASLGAGLTISRNYDKRLRLVCEVATGKGTTSQTSGTTAITVTGSEQSK